MGELFAPDYNKDAEPGHKLAPPRVCALKPALFDADEVYTYTNRGNDYSREGAVVKCLYSKPVEKALTRYDVLFRLALQHYQAEEWERAAEYYRQALVLEPQAYSAWNYLGNVYMDLGNYRQAIACYERMVALNPLSHTALFNLGVAHSDLGESEQAREYYHRAVEIDPEAYSAWNNLGILYARLGDHEQALACYRRAVESAPEFDSGHKNLGFEYFKGGNLALAEIHTSRALELGYPDWAYLDLGHIALAKGDPEKALELYRMCMIKLGDADTFFPALEDDFQYLPQYGVSLETCQLLKARLLQDPVNR